MKLIQTATAATAVSTLTFNSIPQTGKDLAIYLHLRSTASFIGFRVYFNGSNDSAAWQSSRIISTGSSVSVDNGNFQSMMHSTSSSSASAFAPGFIYINGYATSGRIKTLLGDSYGESYSSTSYGGLVVQRWNLGDAITSITFEGTTSSGTGGGAFAAGSTVSLYSIG